MIKYCFATAFKINNFSLLEDRALISLQGSDVWQLLQGIATNDIVKYQNSQEQSLYTAFLNTQGRIICDAILIKPHIMKAGEWVYNKDELWIDVEYHQKKIFKDNLKKYLIRKKVEINDINDLHILGIYSELMKHEDKLGSSINQDQDGEIEDGDYKNQVFSDPRLQSLGLRIITDDYEQIEMDPTSMLIQSQDVYRAYRYSKGVLEGTEIANQLPYSVNLDFLNGINLQKGCYVGQELAARSYHTGIIRKRCLPVAILNQDDNFEFLELKEQPSLEKENIYLGDQLVGQMLQSQYNFGVAYLKYLDIDMNAKFKCKDFEIRFNPNKQLNKSLKEYKEMINSRQII